MYNFNKKIISEINTNGFCKIDNFFKEEDLKDIQRQHRSFEQNAKKYFLDFLEEEIADGHLG